LTKGLPPEARLRKKTPPLETISSMERTITGNAQGLDIESKTKTRGGGTGDARSEKLMTLKKKTRAVVHWRTEISLAGGGSSLPSLQIGNEVQRGRERGVVKQKKTRCLQRGAATEGSLSKGEKSQPGHLFRGNRSGGGKPTMKSKGSRKKKRRSDQQKRRKEKGRDVAFVNYAF